MGIITAAADLSLDTARANELATMLGDAESEMTTVFAGETGDTGITLPGTSISDVSITAIARVSEAARTVVSECKALSAATSAAVTEFQNQDTNNAIDLTTKSGALS